MGRSRHRGRTAVIRLAVASMALALLALVPAQAAAITASVVKDSGWKTSSDPDLSGLKVKLWMSRVPITSSTPCDFTIYADFDWTKRPPNRFYGGSLQYPDSLGITFVVTENKLIRKANTHSQALYWSGGGTRAPDDVDPGTTGVVWSFRELDASNYMTSGQVRFTITRGLASCTAFSITAQARYLSNDGLTGGPVNVSISWFVGVGYDVGGVSENGKLDVEWTYNKA